MSSEPAWSTKKVLGQPEQTEKPCLEKKPKPTKQKQGEKKKKRTDLRQNCMNTARSFLIPTWDTFSVC